MSEEEKRNFKKKLVAKFGEVLDTSELSKKFEVLGFMAGFVAVEDKATKQRGSFDFSHMPRFYFNFCAE